MYVYGACAVVTLADKNADMMPLLSAMLCMCFARLFYASISCSIY